MTIAASPSGRTPARGAAAAWAGRWGPIAAAAVLLHPASAAGLAFPDLDFVLRSVLGHRSAITHSAVLPLLALAALLPMLRRRAARLPRWEPLARGLAWTAGWFLLGLAIHLLADLFPAACRGGALAHLPRWPPGSGSFALSCAASLAWFGANAAIAVLAAEWLLRREGRPLTLLRYLASAVVLALYVLGNEEKPLLLPVLAAAWLATALAARAVLRWPRT